MFDWLEPDFMQRALAAGLILLEASRQAYARIRPSGHAQRIAEPALTPQRRTMGTGLPGYQAGWYRLKNGERALLYLTDRSRAVYVPTTAGYSVLLSPAEPDAFMSAIRSIGR